MLNFDTPRIRLSLGQAALREPYPCWHLDPYGVVRSANLMAFWLWGELQHGQTIQPDLLIGKNIFDIHATNIDRIPFYHNVEFYTKQSALAKRATANQVASPSLAFDTAMKADTHYIKLYDDTLSDLERVWEYPLVITAPESEERLELRVTHYLLQGEAGLLAQVCPTDATLRTFEELYRELMNHYGQEAYVVSGEQEEPSVSNSFLANLPDIFRVYYPTLVLDPLWYLAEENKASQKLFGGSALGMHFLELFFDPQIRPWLGPLQETSAPRALRYFEAFTAPLQQENHELHADYRQVLQRLSHLPEFHRLVELSWKSTMHLTLPEDKETPFYTYRMFLPWPLAPEVTLHFRTFVRYLHKGLLLGSDQQYYQITLVPENYETKVALLLLYLSSGPQEQMHTVFRQRLWGLTLLKTLREGLDRLGGEEYTLGS
jgi:hypothetical protein